MLWIVIQPMVDLVRDPAGRDDPADAAVRADLVVRTMPLGVRVGVLQRRQPALVHDGRSRSSGCAYQTHDAERAGDRMLSPTPCLLSINNYFYPARRRGGAVPRAEPDVRGDRLAGRAVRDAAREESAYAMGGLLPRRDRVRRKLRPHQQTHARTARDLFAAGAPKAARAVTRGEAAHRACAQRLPSSLAVDPRLLRKEGSRSCSRCTISSSRVRPTP